MSCKLLFSGLLVALAIPAQAINMLATNTYSVATDQTVPEEQWVLATQASTEGLFSNDLFIATADQLQLGGTYQGNVWGASPLDVTMEGHGKKNVRLIAKTIRLNGSIDGNLMALAETIIIGTNALIKGDVRLLGSSIVQEGRIGGNAVISSGRLVTLDGTIAGNLEITAPDILFAPGARIAGNLTYTAGKELVPAEGVVAGQLNRRQVQPEPVFSKARLHSHAMWYLAAILAGIPFIALFPMTTAMASQLARQSTWKCMLIGFIASGALPFLGIMCLSSIIGLPLGTLVLAAWGTLLYLGRIIMALLVGTLVLHATGTSASRVLLAMAIGLAIIYTATFIPAIGLPVQMTVVWIGMGSLILALLEKRRLIIQVPQNLKKLEALRDEKYNPEEEES
jgi:cytoskeletal protein CcmA (bactofilin family)